MKTPTANRDVIGAPDGQTSMVTDHELKERITTYLHQRHEAPLRNLHVEIQNGAAVLSGRVRSYYQKQLATACCQRVAGVVRVVNRLTVSDADESTNAVPLTARNRNDPRQCAECDSTDERLASYRSAVAAYTHNRSSE